MSRSKAGERQLSPWRQWFLSSQPEPRDGPVFSQPDPFFTFTSIFFHQFLSNTLKNQLLCAVANFFQNLRKLYTGLAGRQGGNGSQTCGGQNAPESWGTH